MTEVDRPLTRKEMREKLATQAGDQAGTAIDRQEPVVEPQQQEPVVEPVDTVDAAEVADTTETKASSKREKSVWAYLGNGIMVGVLLLVILVGALAIVVPAVTGSKALTVATGSMQPALPPGTMIVVKPIDPKQIKPGDVLTYQLKSGEPTLITHRVTQQLQLADGAFQFITKGDNNPQADPVPVNEVQVVGTVWYSIPLIGWVSQWVTGDMRQWLIPLVVGGLFVYATYMIISGLRDRAKKKKA